MKTSSRSPANTAAGAGDRPPRRRGARLGTGRPGADRASGRAGGRPAGRAVELDERRLLHGPPREGALGRQPRLLRRPPPARCSTPTSPGLSRRVVEAANQGRVILGRARSASCRPGRRVPRLRVRPAPGAARASRGALPRRDRAAMEMARVDRERTLYISHYYGCERTGRGSTT